MGPCRCVGFNLHMARNTYAGAQMTDTYYDYNDEDLMALCVWREARGEGMLGRRGVAHVIKNRSLSPCWWGKDIRSVILKPRQFSSFNDSDPNSTKFPTQDERDWVEIKAIVQGVRNGSDYDITNFSTFYHDTSIEF